MERVKISGKKPLGIIIAVLCMLTAIVIGGIVAHRDNAYPSSKSAEITAEELHVASTVGGRLVELKVHENQQVRRGDLLYRLDPEPYALTVAQMEANYALADAEVANQERLVAAKSANATAAREQVTRATTNRDLAARTVTRLTPLAAHSYVPRQEYDTAQTSLRDAETSLAQAEAQRAAAEVVIGDLKSSMAARDAAKAALDHARYELRQTEVHAWTDGYVTSLRVTEGEVLAPSQVLFTLISNESWFTTANFRETDLGPVRPGDCATVYSMIDRNTALRGHVDSIGWGVLSSDAAGPGRILPVVPREMDWVRVAQRFPVRIRLDPADPRLLRLGATATVQIRHGAACP